MLNNTPINTPIDQYALFGNPVAHSRSPFLHAAFASQCQQALNYRAILVAQDQFAGAVAAFITTGGRGANVTLPFKIEAYALCDQLTERASAAGAVNTLTFTDGQIAGDNTDGCGLVRDITVNAGVPLQGARILLLGAGGAARGALLPLLAGQPAQLVIANRSPERAQQLAQDFQHAGPISASPLQALTGQFDLVINATSASVTAQMPELPGSVYRAGTLAYDMMYGDQPSPFLQHAAQHQAHIRDGWGMLVEQAGEAFFGWRGVRPDTGTLLKRAGSL